MIHCFDTELAKEYGLVEALILQHLQYWIAKNEANQRNYYDGRYWTYNSNKAYQELFPYLSKRKIEYALDKLIKAGIIMVGNYNSNPYDRTLWYAFTDFGKSISQNVQIDLSILGNGNGNFVKCINTDIEPINKPINNTNKGFVRPSVQEVADYVKEANLNVDAQAFIDYYDSNGWKVGKVKMKDWKATCRGWHRREKPKSEIKSTYDIDKITHDAMYNDDYDI